MDMERGFPYPHVTYPHLTYQQGTYPQGEKREDQQVQKQKLYYGIPSPTNIGDRI
jgi:hypothetical protein